MRRLVVTGAALAVLVSSGAAAATTEPPDSSPTTEEGTDAETVAEGSSVTDTSTSDTSTGDETAPATVYDDSGEPVATITVLGAQTAWTDYAEGSEPDEGREYVQVTVDVASTVTEGSFEISVGDFILQDQHGFVTTAESIASAAQSEADEDIVADADLANGESLELALTFQVDAAAGPQSVFYRPDDERLVDVAEVG
jgi:hypothetical protein